ncbi:MAG TPA: enoyl-CoA hydratase/isomerase family protein [Acidimicrobiales bacterium]|nr:enoyl-CoA hydratase/isomerase family protein [Acidimicrobiales bacterium]
MIEIERTESVWIIRMRSGENRFNRDSVDGLHRHLDEIERHSGPLALVTTGEGKFYSNGLDLDWMAQSGETAGPLLDDVHRLLGRLLLFPALTVAAVNGHAFAAGAMLASAHDVVVMREDRGYWCLPEVDLGLPLTEAMFAVLAAKVPHPTLHDAVLTGRRYGAAEAVTAGIVHHAVPVDAVLDRAVELATSWAGKNRTVVAAHKRLMYADAAGVCGMP